MACLGFTRAYTRHTGRDLVEASQYECKFCGKDLSSVNSASRVHHLKDCGNRPPEERPVPKARPRKKARKTSRGRSQSGASAANGEARPGPELPGSSVDARVAALQKELAECDAIIAQAKERYVTARCVELVQLYSTVAAAVANR